MNIWILTFIILTIAVFMTMTGHGGGNFFVIALVLWGINMHIAAATGQFILFTSAFFAMLVYGRKKFIEWRLAVFIGVLIGIPAFFGGFFSDFIHEKYLKLILAGFLLIIAFLMLKPVKKDIQNQIFKTDWMYWNIQSVNKSKTYPVNLLFIIPVLLLIGFTAGMVGISGGSFIVPLLVLWCHVPMKNAVGTASSLVAVSAITGFMGHFVSGHFDYRIAVPLTIGGAIGGLIGGSVALKTKPAILKILFAITTLVAAVIMAFKVFY
jgi:uncharacterized membrane protein YfcA